MSGTLDSPLGHFEASKLMTTIAECAALRIQAISLAIQVFFGFIQALNDV